MENSTKKTTKRFALNGLITQMDATTLHVTVIQGCHLLLMLRPGYPKMATMRLQVGCATLVHPGP